jgi:hypothetical protein
MGFKLKVSFWGRDGKVPHPLPHRERGDGRGPCVFVPDAHAAFDYIRKTEEYKASKHMLQHTWQFRTITPELMTDLVKLRRIFAYGHNDNIRGLLIIQPGRYESGRLEISFVEGDRKALAEFREQVRQFAHSPGLTVSASPRLRVPASPTLSGMARSRSMLRHLGGLGMRPWRRPSKLPWVLVYEYPLKLNKTSSNRNTLTPGRKSHLKPQTRHQIPTIQ